MALDKGTGARRPKSLRRQPVKGESAADKARVQVQGRGRDVIEEIVRGAPAAQVAPRLREVERLLTPAERRDLRGYSKVRSEQVRRRIDPQEKIAGALVGPQLAKLLPGGSPAREAFDSPGWLALEAAGILPFGRALRGGAAGAKKAAEVVRPAGADKIVEALPEARRLQRQQDAIRSGERSKRVSAADEAYELAGGGEEGFLASRAAMRGEYTSLPFHGIVKAFSGADDGMRAILEPQKRGLLEAINNHPSLVGKRFAIANTQEALLKALHGELPTKSEIRLLENVFGDEAADTFRWARAHDRFVKAINLPRSMMATLDISFPFRQGLVVAAQWPSVWLRSWGPMLRAFASPRVAKAVQAEIDARPTRKLMDTAGVKFTELAGSVARRDEHTMSEWAERVPLIGIGVRAANRAFVTAGNRMRADVFDLLYEQAEEGTGGLLATVTRRSNPPLSELSAREQRKLLNSIGSLINAATGRGGMGLDMLEKAAPLLTAGLFSPRLIASRVALLNPAYYATLHPFARKQAASAMIRLFAAGTIVLWLAKRSGAEVDDDPRSADFGKIKVNDTRVDIWGGFQQYVVNGYRIAVKESVSSTTGEVRTLEGGFGEQSRYDIARRFLEGKASPPAAWLIGSGKGKTAAGEEFDELREAGKSFLPLGFQNAYEGFQEGPGVGAVSTVLGSIGFGVQTYGGDTKKKGSGRPRRSSSLRSGGGRKRSSSLRRP